MAIVVSEETGAISVAIGRRTRARASRPTRCASTASRCSGLRTRRTRARDAEVGCLMAILPIPTLRPEGGVGRPRRVAVAGGLR